MGEDYAADSDEEYDDDDTTDNGSWKYHDENIPRDCEVTGFGRYSVQIGCDSEQTLNYAIK